MNRRHFLLVIISTECGLKYNIIVIFLFILIVTDLQMTMMVNL